MHTIPKEQAKPPFRIVILDLLDAMHYADVFDDVRYGYVPNINNDFTNLDRCITITDQIFAALNPKPKTQEEWYRYDEGWDVRVYDSEHACVYAGHQKLPEPNKT